MCAPQLVCRGATACCRQAPTDVLLSLLMPQTRAVEQLQAERDALAQSNWSQSVRHSQLELAKVGGMLAIAENAFQCRNVHATVCRRLRLSERDGDGAQVQDRAAGAIAQRRGCCRWAVSCVSFDLMVVSTLSCYRKRQ